MINIKIDTTKKLNLRTIAKSTFANKWTVVDMSIFPCLEVSMFIQVTNNFLFFHFLSISYFKGNFTTWYLRCWMPAKSVIFLENK